MQNYQDWVLKKLLFITSSYLKYAWFEAFCIVNKPYQIYVKYITIFH